MSKYIILLIAILSATNVFAVTSLYHSKYDWDTTITFAPLTTAELGENAIILLDNRVIEYVNGEEDDEYYMYITRHKRIRVNNDKGIDEYNKVFVPINEDDEVVVLKARSIAKDGTVKVLNEEKIKSLENYESYGNFALFAIEGVEKGGEIEYIYTVKRSAESFGRESYQTDVKIKKASFTLITNDELKFGTYGYNGFPYGEFVKDGERYVLSITVNDMEALYEEAYSGYDASKKRIAYKLIGKKGETGRLFTWNDAGLRYISTVYRYPSDFDAAKFMKSIKLNKLATIEEKIHALEHYLKTSVAIKLESTPGLSDPQNVVSRRYGNEMGLTRVYALCLLEMGIKHQIVVSCNRYDNKFIAEFEDYYNLDEFLIYLPEFKKYISPTNIELRLGVPPSYLAGNKALFVSVPFGYGQVSDLPVMEYKDNTVGLDAEVFFNKQMESVTVKKKQSWTGYTAYGYRVNLAYANEQEKEEFIKELMTSGLNDAVIKSKTTVNDNIQDNTTNKLLELNGEFTSEALLENAGSSYIFKVGDLIGPQAQLYQEHERQTDVKFPFPKQYLHHIYFTIPDGYSVKGLEDAKIEKKLEDKGEVLASFTSGYTIEGNVVHIRVHEIYTTPELEKKLYEGFRSVINAAADFNKVVLVLEPTK